MSGVAIVRYLLAHNAGMTAQVPATRIMAGALPLNTALPAIGITEVSGVQAQYVDSQGLVTERVQVDVLATSYREQKDLLALVRAALPRSRGTVDGQGVDSILPDSEGPDMFLSNPDIWSQSQDFMVKFSR